MTNLIRHYSIGLETLDTCNNAVILTIAIVTDQGDELVLSPSVNQQIRNGRSVNADTFRWWLEQSDDARRAIIDAREQPCGMVSTGVFDFFRETAERRGDSYTVWGSAPSFDCDILADFLCSLGSIKSVRPKKPWPRGAERDVSTARMAVGRTNPDTARDALSDARAQLADALKFVRLCEEVAA